MVMLADAAIVVCVATETPLLLTQTRTQEILLQCCPFARLDTELVAKLSFQTSVKTEECNSPTKIYFLIGIVGVESYWIHSALRPPVGLLCQPPVIMTEKLVE
jgi:hypothetical protein